MSLSHDDMGRNWQRQLDTFRRNRINMTVNADVEVAGTWQLDDEKIKLNKMLACRGASTGA